MHCVGVTRVYRVGGQDVAALRGVDLEVAAGTFVAITGRSGSGKTTLLNLIGGLDRPTSGEVYLAGRPLSGLTEQDVTELHRNRIGFVFQSFGLLPSLPAWENVALPLRIVGVAGRERDERVRHCLELVGLAEWATHKPYELSGGQQQRLAIARALVNEPPLILADEPTGELDSGTTEEIFGLFRRLVAASGLTIIAATHDPLVEDYADSVVLLRDGRVAQRSPVE